MNPEFKSLYSAINIPMVVQDSNFKILDTNQAFDELFGLGHVDIVEIMSPGVRASARMLRTVLFEMDAFSIDTSWPLYSVNDDLKKVKIFTSKIFYDNAFVYVAVLFLDEFYRSFIDIGFEDFKVHASKNNLLDVVGRYQEIISNQALEISHLRDVIRMSVDNDRRSKFFGEN